MMVVNMMFVDVVVNEVKAGYSHQFHSPSSSVVHVARRRLVRIDGNVDVMQQRGRTRPAHVSQSCIMNNNYQQPMINW